MSPTLKSTILLLAKKYSWHTLGENVPAGSRNTCTAINNGVTSTPKITKKKRGPVQSNISTAAAQATVHKIIKFNPNTKSKRLIAEREELTQEIYREYNEMAFEGMLPTDLDISWSKRLTSTAGVTKMSSQTRGVKKIAEIVLSEKVCDDTARLRSTLLHEMCHSAAWLLDSERKPPHGPGFWKWASICSANIPGMLVSTCHSYKIHKPYQFHCVECKQVYGRHSKRGVDIMKQCCGICKGKIEFTGIFNADGTPKRPRQAILID